MKTLKLALVLITVFITNACGGGGGDSVVRWDNSLVRSSGGGSLGYSGGDVLFGGYKITGEWQARRTLNKSGLDESFFQYPRSTRWSSLGGVKFDSNFYYEYHMEFVTINYLPTTSGGWTRPLAMYGVSSDGLILTIDLYPSKKSYTYVRTSMPCIIIVESVTADEYQLCKQRD